MNIHWRFPKGWHLDVSWHRRQPVLGVNSKLTDGHHILMWDFDNVEFTDVLLELGRVQMELSLPEIYIFTSSRKGNYHAYCLRRSTWAAMLFTLASTKGIDQQFFKLGIMRGYMTLRFSDKIDSRISYRHTILSSWQNEVTWSELQNFERYWTVRRKHAR